MAFQVRKAGVAFQVRFSNPFRPLCALQRSRADAARPAAAAAGSATAASLTAVKQTIEQTPGGAPGAARRSAPVARGPADRRRQPVALVARSPRLARPPACAVRPGGKGHGAQSTPPRQHEQQNLGMPPLFAATSARSAWSRRSTQGTGCRAVGGRRSLQCPFRGRSAVPPGPLALLATVVCSAAPGASPTPQAHGRTARAYVPIEGVRPAAPRFAASHSGCEAPRDAPAAAGQAGKRSPRWPPRQERQRGQGACSGRGGWGWGDPGSPQQGGGR